MTSCVRLTVHLTPRGGDDRIEGVRDGVLRVRVAAAPARDAANRALVKLLAGGLGSPQSALRIVAGRTDRTKLIEVEGVEAATIAGTWPGIGVRDVRR